MDPVQPPPLLREPLPQLTGRYAPDLVEEDAPGARLDHNVAPIGQIEEKLTRRALVMEVVDHLEPEVEEPSQVVDC